jgi:hypothetical protein
MNRFFAQDGAAWNRLKRRKYSLKPTRSGLRLFDTADVIAGVSIVCPQPTRVSVALCGPVPLETNGHSFQPMLSSNGSRIVYASDSSRLLNGNPCPDINGRRDVFLRDLAASTTTRFSVASDGTPGNGHSMNPDLTGDGRVVVYESLATNLLGPGGDMNTQEDVFQSPSPQGPFIRGDANHDGIINLSDSIWIYNWLFQGGPAPQCYDAADANDDGSIDGSDPAFLNNFLFTGGSAPRCPFCCSPTTSCCGKDPTGDGLPCGVSLVGCTPFSALGGCP